MALNLLHTFKKLSSLPGGRRLFSAAVCNRAPYFSTINPKINELEPGRCVAVIRNRRRVQNHIGTVHAIAMCNLAELTGGLATDVTIPNGWRWIPRGMEVEYLAKATSDLRATATVNHDFSGDDAREVPAKVEVHDQHDQLVFRANIRMWVSPKPKR